MKYNLKAVMVSTAQRLASHSQDLKTSHCKAREWLRAKTTALEWWPGYKVPETRAERDSVAPFRGVPSNMFIWGPVWTSGTPLSDAIHTLQHHHGVGLFKTSEWIQDLSFSALSTTTRTTSEKSHEKVRSGWPVISLVAIFSSELQIRH